MRYFQEETNRITDQLDGSCPVSVGADDVLQLLDDAIKCRAQQGESVLRLVLANDLLPTAENWYNHCVDALKEKLSHVPGVNDRQLLLLFKRYPYAVKIIWFRLAYEEYRGDNYQKVFADCFGINLTPLNRSQLMDFACVKPFAFEDEVSFRSYLWCLRFANEGDSVRGISSFTARALRVIDNMEEGEACSSDSELYSRLENGQDVCKHIRIVLKSEWRRDFVEFIHVFKNRHALGNENPWLGELYESARRVVVGIKRREARDSGRPDQLPQITLDFSGNVVLEPPVETSYEENTYSNGDEFTFYRSMDIKPCEGWRFVDGVFDCDHRSILLKKLRKIEFKRNGDSNTSEITKYLITDEKSGIGVYNVCPSVMPGCGYSLGYRCPVFYKDDEPEGSQKLHEGEYYKVVSTKGELIPVMAYSAECAEGEHVPLNEFSRVGEAQSNVFRVPKGALKLQVGGLLFDIADCRIDKLVHNPRLRLSCVKNERGGPVGFRFFYKRDAYPVQDITHVVGLWYEFDGCRQPLQIITTPHGGWNAPSDWLWHSNGRLVMETDDRGERAFPVTFVDVDFSEIETPAFTFGEKRHVHLRTGDVSHELDIGSNDVEVDLEYRGIHFRPQINREGVQLRLRGKVIALTNGRTPGVEVSYDDINDDVTTLHIKNTDASNMKFFYGDMLHPLDIPLRQDGTVQIKRLIDVSSIRDALPVDCMISPFSGMGAYSFRIYDSKSAVLEVAHGNYEKRVIVDRLANSDDLHIRYFSSYRHHVTANKIELAYLLSHRQDEKPRFFPLEERMRVDDPQGLGRCVESVVAKDFFKQDVEWGTGVIGFVVERSQFSVRVQTTGFFIAASNPTPVCLDGDILKDLRIALSERQVRRDVPMSDEDRQRLKRIENEFMSDDSKKQEALREYIRNAATVAIEMNALGSINSFCNSIRNRCGELSWVSGFVFMAGWFVRDYIEDDGSFNMDWPFPPYWSSLLVAYRYKEPRRPMPDQATSAKGLIFRLIESLLVKNGECWYVNNTENEQMLVGIERMIGKLIPESLTAPSGTGVFVQGVDNCAKCIFCTRGLETVEHSFGYHQFFKTLDVLGEALHQWRMHPTLNESLRDESEMPEMTLQDLRESLLFVDEIDRQILGVPLCRELVNNKSAELYFNDNNK